MENRIKRTYRYITEMKRVKNIRENGREAIFEEIKAENIPEVIEGKNTQLVYIKQDLKKIM